MRVSYFREMREHHLVITDTECICPDYQIKMVQENEIIGLFRPAMCRVNEETEYDYSITGFQSLQTFAEGEPISGKVLGLLVEKLCQLLEEMERYLIDGEYLALRPEFIYLKRDREAIIDVSYCFFPFREQALEEQLRELFKFITNEVDYQEKEAVDLAYELYQAVLQEPVDFSELLRTARRLTGEREKEAEDVKEWSAESEMGLAVEKEVLGKYERTAEEMKVARAAGGNYPAVISAEEILWVDERVMENKPQKRLNRKSTENREITLPDQRKKSILGLISRH